ncbi:uncharacterized protein Tco025E_01567 [Trypanosoma conorhini]|uniref:Uncharacterized protein n=1 Tax=Trypanosoma conorhini TaxID=83891 RepID=A0A422Q8B4_9TRYP|nr:uncharacterized protein Tco025E_01567 [Trypanosoma conorhini]RNF26167.1 hypothetical protein Tco025E_01567 [Trypanosoma conorhini]
MLGGPAGLPENIIRGSTTFCLTHVGDRAYYIPRGCTLEDRLSCWRVKADRETGRIFFVSCGGLGRRWTLPDAPASNCGLPTEAPSGGPRCRSSSSGPSPNARRVAGEDNMAVLEAAARPLAGLSTRAQHSHGDEAILSLPSPSPSPGNVYRGAREQTPPPLDSVKSGVADIYLNDFAYLRSFDAEVHAPASAATTLRGKPAAVGVPREGGGAESAPLEAQLRRRIEDYAEEVATLRQTLEEQERLLMERDLAQLELEERMVNMRLHMMEAVSAHRKAIPLQKP